MSREPLLFPALAFSLGILVAAVIPLSPLALRPVVIFGALAIVFAVCFRKRKRFLQTSVALAFLTSGAAVQIVHRPGPAPRLNAEDGEIVLLSGCVTNPPVFSPGREQFTFALSPTAAARVSVNLKQAARIGLSYGQQVEAPAKIRAPRNFQNPNAFDYTGYLAAQHIYWTASIGDPAEIKIMPGTCGSKFVKSLYGIRTWALDRLDRLYPDDTHTSALLKATLIGETSGVERQWTSDFRITGTYHALVISGQHVSVLAFTLLFILRLVHLRRVPALFVATAASWLYAFITGFSAPVVRAAGGFTLFLLGSYFFRKTKILNVLAVVALIYLAFDPAQLFDPSFQLSFLSAAAIAAFAIPAMDRITQPFRAAVKRIDQVRYDPQVEVRAAQWRVEFRLLSQTLCAWTSLSEETSLSVVSFGVRTVAFVLDAVIVSACVQFGLALPMITYFHRLSITGLSANIFIIPLLSLVVPLGFAAILTGLPLIATVTGICLHAAEWVAAWHVRIEPSWRLGAIPLGISIAFAASLFLLAVAIRRARAGWIAPVLASSLALFGIICWQPWKAELRPNMLEVTAIDVSQGDSLLVVFPNGQTMLVDAGGFPGMERVVRKPQIDMGEDVISPYLWSRRIRHLDYAVLTHGHSDHMGGLAAILDNFRPSALWIGAEPATDAWKKIEARAAADQVAVRPLTRSSPPLTIGGVAVRFLAPSPEYVPGDFAQNNDSLVLELRYGRRSVLLTGDAEQPVEDDMLKSVELHPVTLLKTGHHGSKTSSSEEFVSAISPTYAFISDGFKNQFHHPHPSVLQRFEDHHTAVYRTDQNGLLTFFTDGDKVKIETFR